MRLDARQKRITIEDNGRGMDWAGLGNFFVMHGENVDREAGRPGRGRFGTGKSAAFDGASPPGAPQLTSKARPARLLRLSAVPTLWQQGGLITLASDSLGDHVAQGKVGDDEWRVVSECFIKTCRVASP